MLSNIIAIASIVIAAASLFVSVKVYRRDTPHLSIDIPNPKYDCFFGNVQIRSDSDGSTYRIGGIHCLLNNGTQADIEVIDAFLLIGKEKYSLIPNNNPYWKNVPFLVPDYDNPKYFIPDENYAISYSEQGLSTPYVIKAYSAFNGYFLFYSFPANIKGRVSAIFCVKTPMGMVKKKVNLLEYDNTFAKQEWEDVDQYLRSLEGRK